MIKIKWQGNFYEVPEDKLSLFPGYEESNEEEFNAGKTTDPVKETANAGSNQFTAVDTESNLDPGSSESPKGWDKFVTGINTVSTLFKNSTIMGRVTGYAGGILEGVVPGLVEAELQAHIEDELFGKKRSEISQEDTDEFIRLVMAQHKATSNMKSYNEWDEAYDDHLKAGGNALGATLYATTKTGINGLVSQMTKSLVGQGASFLGDFRTDEEKEKNELIVVPGGPVPFSYYGKLPYKPRLKGTKGAAAGAGAAVALNATGVAAMLPEELVTVPLFTAAGFTKEAASYMETMLSYSAQIQEALVENNMDITSENLQKLFDDRELIEQIEDKSAKRGDRIGWVEAIGLFVGLKGATAATRGTRGALFGSKNKVVKGLGGSKGVANIAGLSTASTVEMGAGAFGEYLGLKAEGKDTSTDESIKEIIVEGITGPVSSAPLTLVNQFYQRGFKKSKYKINGKPVSEARMKRFLDKNSRDIGDADLEAENDPYVQNLINDQQNKQKIYSELKNTRVTDQADQDKIVDLELEKQKLENKKGRVAKNRIAEINKEIDEIDSKYAKTGRKSKATLDFEAKQEQTKKDIQNRNVTSTVRFLKEEGGKFGLEPQVYDSNEEIAEALRYAGATEEQIEQFFKDSKESSIGGGIFNNIAYINRNEASKTGQINVGAHEILHGILDNVVGDDAAQAKLVENFKKVLTNKQKRKIEAELTEREVDPSEWNKEYITTFADLIRETKNQNHISFNDGIMNKINNILSDIFRGKLGIGTIGFADGRQTYNFLREYNKSIEKGKLSESISNLYTPEQQTSAFSRANSKRSIPEKSLSELTKDYQENPAEADIEGLLTQYYSTGIDALKRWGASGGRNVPVIDILKDEEKRNEIQSLFNSQFNSFIKNFKGDLSEATTYMNNIVRRVGPAMMEFIEESKVGRLEDNTKETESKVDTESSVEEIIPTIDPVVDLLLTEGMTVDEVSQAIVEIKEAYLKGIEENNIDLTNLKTIKDASPETTQKYFFGETKEQELKTFKEKDETLYNLSPENQRRRNIKGTTKSATGVVPSMRNNFYVKAEPGQITATGRAGMDIGTPAGLPIQVKIPFDKFIPALSKFDTKDHGKPVKQKFGELAGTIGPTNRNQATFRNAIKQQVGKLITAYVAAEAESNAEIAADMVDGKSPMSYSRRAKPSFSKDNVNESFYNDNNKFNGKQIAEEYPSWKKSGGSWYNLNEKGSGMKYANGIKTIVSTLEEVGLWPKGFIKKSQIAGASKMFGKENRNEYDIMQNELNLESDKQYSATRPDQKFGKTGKEAKRKATKKAVNEFNINNTRNFLTFWKGIFYILRTKPELAPTVFHMLSHSVNNRNHYHALGAKLLYINFNAKNLRWEHALQNANAFKYLFAIGLDPKANTDIALKTLMNNYVLVGLDVENDAKLDGTDFKEKMSSETEQEFMWNVSKNFWWQRYFNFIVGQVNGGINPNNLTNPVTGKTLTQEIGINQYGEPTTAQLMEFENSANSQNTYSKRKKATNLDKAKQLDAEVDALQKKHYSGKNLEKEFNDIVAMKTGIKSEARFKSATARIRGEKKGKGLLNMLVPPRMQDFMGLMYNIIGAGKFGRAQMQWFEDNFSRPYAKAMNDFASARVALMEDFKALKNSLGIIPKNLKEEVPGTIYTKEHAIRVFIWTKLGFEIPDISKKDHKALVKFIKNNPQLEAFANKLIEIQKGDKYIVPTESWMAGGIVPDLLENLNTTTRKKYLRQWQENVDKVFTKETLNKLEAAFGKAYRQAIEKTLRRMSTGINKKANRDPYIGKFVDWLNGSIGVIMFFNTRSALLQTISMANFINHTDNNIFAAGKAFLNQKQFWSDFMMLFNSDFLRDRRGGLRINVNEADIAEMAKKQGAAGVIHKLLQFGFLPTQIADSFAIASGGASFYRNRVNRYIKDGMSQKDAEAQAFQDFRENAEESQQSSRADKISEEQAGDLGRLILAFGNTPSQYFRIMNKQYRDMKNKRRMKGLTLPQSQIARAQVILYYLVVQNIIFNAMQQALFALGFEDEEDEKLIKDKAFATANGMADSVLRGMGLVGVGISTIKNAGLKIHGELGKSRPNYEKAVDELLNASPPIDSKITRLKQAARIFQWEQKAIKQKGLSMDNPALMAVAQIIAAGTNVPLDRGLRKFDNITTAFEQDLDLWQRLALLGGWSDWQIGIEDQSEYVKTKKSSKIKKSKLKSRIKKRF